MADINSPEEGYPVTTREIDLNAWIRKSYGKDWNAPELQYKFSNGREIKMRTQEDIYDQP